MLCLRVLQSALVYVNTLMVQDVLADDDWADRMTDVDCCSLTPLFATHVAPYGEVRLKWTDGSSSATKGPRLDRGPGVLSNLAAGTRSYRHPILPELSPSLSRAAHRVLAQRGVEIRTQTTIEEACDDGVRCPTGSSCRPDR